MSYVPRSLVVPIACPYPRQVGQTVSFRLLNIQISPSHGHKISSIGVVLNHVEMRTTALCILNHSPSIHCIQGAAVQTCDPGLCFQGLSEGSEESIVVLHIILLRYQVRILLLYQLKEVMQDTVVLLQGGHQSIGITKGWSMGAALFCSDVG
jgi:hypothetical protein